MAGVSSIQNVYFVVKIQLAKLASYFKPFPELQLYRRPERRSIVAAQFETH